MNEFMKPGLHFMALGGAEKVGMNMYAYMVDGRIIVVDCGYDFLNDDFPGIDLGFADATFLENNRDYIDALFITHSHEDHFGAIAHVWPRLKCPVYATDFTIEHILPRLHEYHLDDEVEIHSVNDNPLVKLENFEVEFVPLAHSLPENSALVIRTKYGTVFHATDWRFDDGKIDFMKTDIERIKEIGKEGISLYVGDSILMGHPKKQPSETDIRQSLIDLVPRFKNTLVATCFSSNIARMQSLILAAHAAGRTPVVAGMSLMQNINIARDCGYMEGMPLCIEAKQAKDIPLDKMLYICAGSQGNYRSGLTRLVNGENKDIKLGKGDAIIFSSQIIPGNEEKIERMQEKLRDAEVEVISSEDYLVHTSGHGCIDDIRQMFEILHPTTVIPVHGDKRDIRKQRRYAEDLGVKNVLVVRDGDVVNLLDNEAQIVSQIPTGHLGVDRNQITDLNSQLIKNRKRIAYNGSLYISAFFNDKWQLQQLEISSIDVLEEGAWDELSEKIKADMIKSLPSEIVKLNYREEAVSEYIRAKIRKQVFKATAIKPVTFMHFYKIPQQEDE